MISFFSPSHAKHAPTYEFFRGDKVPCFESPARAEFVRTALIAHNHELREPNTDSRALLSKVHTPRYLNFLETAWQQWVSLDAANDTRQPFPSVWPTRTLRSDIEPTNFVAKLGLYSMDNGSPMVAGTWEAAKAGADCAAGAAALVSSGARSAFSASRPPGHHAGADFMGGYCFLNNAAIAAEGLLAHGAKRVAILDVDYHHANGTQSIFDARADVMMISIHGDPRTEYPFYLGHADETGTGAGAGFTLNLPLPAGSHAPAWFSALNVACTRIEQHHADALVISLGLDTFVDDPISTFTLRTEDYQRLGAQLAQLNLPTVFILEGGYAAAALGTNAASVLTAFENG